MKRNLFVSAILAAVILGVAAYAIACAPSWADWCRVRYRSAGDHTMVLLDCNCGPSGTATWYVSFFVGDQPTLWEYAEIQNTASDLIR